MKLTRAPAVATIPVTDIKRARGFYSEKLGLELCDGNLERGELLYETGSGSHLLVYQNPTPPKSDVTQFAFLVDDLMSTVEMLRDRGIQFEEVKLPHVKNVKGIATYDGEKSVWFRDPDGNIIGVTQSEISSHIFAGECTMHSTG
jgi:catechol 2,3-dioxygenase-like lactoylglutathione lyase family enzyme